MSTRRQEGPYERASPPARALSKSASARRDELRFEQLYQIGKLFLWSENVERSFDEALGITARTLPLSSAVLIEEQPVRSRMIVWPSEGRSAAELEEAKANARRLYGYLRGATPESIDARLVEEAGATVLPRYTPIGVPLGVERSIVVPLGAPGRPIFGALQLTAHGPLDEGDVKFVSAIADQLAAALDRRHAWDRDIALRTEAEAGEARMLEQLDFTRAITLSLEEGVVAVDLDGHVTFLNAAAARMLDGVESAKRGVLLADLVQLKASDGSTRELPLTQVLSGGEPARGEARFLTRGPGRQSVLKYAVTAIRRRGAITGAVVVLEDITARRAAEQNESYLLAASNILGSGLDAPETFERLARLLVPRWGDCCFVDVLSGERVERVAAACVSPALEARAADLAPVDIVDHPGAEVIRSGKTVRISDGVKDWVMRTPMGAERRRFFCDIGASSLLMVPMSIGEQRIGVLLFVFAESGRHHDESDAALAEELARRAAFAVERRRLYAEALKQTRLRDQILGVVSHDLRNPISTIRLASDVLAGISVLPDEQGAYSQVLAKLDRGVDRAHRLIEDLLDFANIEAGRLSLELRRLDPTVILREARESLEPLAREKNVRLEIEAGPSLRHVLADRDRIHQVVSNLATNAINVSASGAIVRLRAVPRGDEVLFSVTDAGPGISEADQRHLFDRYWRSDTAKYKGTGLGLAIAKGIVEEHGGRIWVESTLGGGSTFFWTQPSVPRPTASAPQPAR